MKINKYILGFASLLAAAFTLGSCQMEDVVEDPVIATDKAVYQATPEAGQVTVKLSSNLGWTASVAPASSRDNVDDFKLSLKEGTPDTKELIVSFDANKGYNRGAIVTLTGKYCSTAFQIQQEGEQGELVEQITIAEFLEKPVDASIYYEIHGTVTKIAQSNKYSNFYLNDGTAEVYVYGLYDGKDGPQFTDGWLDRMEITVGYTMTIGATRGQYNATIEAMKAYPIEWAAPTTPMINIASTAVSVGANDTEAVFAISALNLNSDWTVTPAENYAWVTDYTKSGRQSGEIKITLTPNEDTENSREAKFTVANADCESIELTLTQGKKIVGGTETTPFTIAEAIAAANAGVKDVVYVKGIVSELYKGGFDAQYGNGSFYMSEDGVRHNDNTLDFEAYQALYLGNQKWNAETNPQMEVGAEIVVCGPLTTYNGLAETQGKGVAYIYSINGVKTDEQGLGFQTKPFTVPGVIAAYAGGVSVKVYVEGVVSELYKGGFDAQYGNGSFYMSEDGVRYKDNAKDFEAYQVNYLQNEKYTADMPQIAVGDKAVIYGPLTIYNGLVETKGKGEGYLYMLNGKTELGDTPGPGPGPDPEPETPTYTTLADAQTAILAGTTEFILDLAEYMEVTFVTGKYVYGQDATGGVLFFGTGAESWLYGGLRFKGGALKCTATVYNGLPEITAVESWDAIEKNYDAKYPCINLTIDELIANYDRYLNCKIKIDGVTVTDGWQGTTDRNGEVAKGDAKINVYAQDKTSEEAIETGCEGNIVAWPTYYKTTKQIGFWPHKEAGKSFFTVTKPAPGPDPEPEPETPTYKTLAEAQAGILAGKTEFILDLAEYMEVTYKNGSSVFAQDATGGVLFYGTGAESWLYGGLRLKGGELKCTAKVYNGLPEITAVESWASVQKDYSAEYPCINVTLADLLADYNRYLNCKVKISGVTVKDGWGASDRDGEIAVGSDAIKVRTQVADSEQGAATGCEGNIIAWPSLYNSTKQLGFWPHAEYPTKKFFEVTKEPAVAPSTAIYTLDTTLEENKGTNNSYAGNGDVTVGDITWNVEGNATMAPWRIGGKSIENTDRKVYTKTACTSALSKVVFTAGTINDITVNSAKLVYSDKEDFSDAKEVTFTPAASSSVDITVDGGFPANSYYMFVFNVTVSASSNKFIQFSKVEFYN